MMTHKRFIQLFFLSPLCIALLLFSINWVVDPFGVTNYNLLDIKYKMARDDRTEKIEVLKKAQAFDNLILGSSRSQHLAPSHIASFLGGKGYNFGIGNGSIEDALGLLIYLKNNDKLPKNVLLMLDFYAFNEEFPVHPSFYKLPELNFLGAQNYETDYMAKFLSIDALRASFKTLAAHIKGKVPGVYFQSDGLAVSTEGGGSALGDRMKIEAMAASYFSYNYSGGNYVMSEQRFAYLKQLIDLCEDNSIQLQIALTPVHHFHLQMVNNHPKLAEQLIQFKHNLTQLHAYWDGMVEHPKFSDDQNFEDSVHYSHELGKEVLDSIYTGKPLH